MTEPQFHIAFSTGEIMREAPGPTTVSKTKLKRIARYLKKASAMCVELPLGCQVARRHLCDRGCRLGWKPKDKVLLVWRGVGNWPVLQCSSLVSDTSNSVTIFG